MGEHLTHVSLFTGIGGLDLAAEAAGFETVLQVEREPFPLRVLEKHWPNVPRITDVREVTSESVSGHVTVVSGGFPCQPFSAAGKRRGADDDRYLWPELLRIVEELRPTWVVGENVSGLLSIRDGMEIDDMLASLEARDYEPWILHYPAAGVGAPHKRDRVFIVAHARNRGGWYGERRSIREDGGREYVQVERSSTAAQVAGSSKTSSAMADCKGVKCHERLGQSSIEPHIQEWLRSEAGAGGQNVAHAKEHGLEIRSERGNESTQQPGPWESSWTIAADRSAQPGMGRVADGFSCWLDEPHGIPRVATGVKDRALRLKALGNAVVPAQAYPIFAAIAEAEHWSSPVRL